jgi:hypothetical protein
MRVLVHDLPEIPTAVHVVIQTARAMAKVHFVQELAQNLVLLKTNVQQKSKEQDLPRQEEEKEKRTGTRKMKMNEKEVKVALDPQKGAASLHQSLDLDHHVSVVGQDPEALLREEVEGRMIVEMMRTDIVYMLLILM